MSLFNVVKNVVTSREVIAATVAIIIYFFIVTQAAKSHSRPSVVNKLKEKVSTLKKKKEKPAEAAATATATPPEAGSDSKDELGIEEG